MAVCRGPRSSSQASRVDAGTVWALSLRQDWKEEGVSQAKSPLPCCGCILPSHHQLLDLLPPQCLSNLAKRPHHPQTGRHTMFAPWLVTARLGDQGCRRKCNTAAINSISYDAQALGRATPSMPGFGASHPILDSCDYGLRHCIAHRQL